jgi:solute:Na+ symporter, SSS family
MVFQQRTARYGWAVAAGVLLAVAHPTAAGDARSERAQLVTVLERTLDQERGWPRIRAAEALIDHGYTGRAFDALAGDADTAPSPERIGVWRVLARSAPAPEGLQFIERIRRAAVDPNGPDRVHAVETLAKLNAYEESDRAVIEAIAGPADPATAAFARWYLALSGRPDDEARLVELLVSPDAVARQRSAYALARLKSPSPAARAAIVAQTERESPGPSPRPRI